jgi:hypothetical protein
MTELEGMPVEEYHVSSSAEYRSGAVRLWQITTSNDVFVLQNETEPPFVIGEPRSYLPSWENFFKPIPPKNAELVIEEHGPVVEGRLRIYQKSDVRIQQGEALHHFFVTVMRSQLHKMSVTNALFEIPASFVPEQLP